MPKWPPTRRSRRPSRRWPTLAGGIGDPHVRHRGTIGGSVANNDPAADYPAACRGPRRHDPHRRRARSPADKFFTGMFSTALKADEIVTAVEFPLPKKAGYAKFPNPASLYAMVGVFVAQIEGWLGARRRDRCGPGVFRVPEMEAALAKSFSAEALAGIAVKAEGPQQRHACLGRISRPFDRCHGEAGRRSGEVELHFAHLRFRARGRSSSRARFCS